MRIEYWDMEHEFDEEADFIIDEFIENKIANARESEYEPLPGASGTCSKCRESDWLFLPTAMENDDFKAIPSLSEGVEFQFLIWIYKCAKCGSFQVTGFYGE